MSHAAASYSPQQFAGSSSNGDRGFGQPRQPVKHAVPGPNPMPGENARFSRSRQLAAINAIAYAEVSGPRLFSATSFTAVLQQVSGSVGITIAAMGLKAAGALRGPLATDLGNFAYVFGMIAALAFSPAFVFSRLTSTAGAALVKSQPAR